MVSFNFEVMFCIAGFCAILGVISAYMIYHYVQEEKKIVSKMKLKLDMDLYEPAFVPTKEEQKKAKKKKKNQDDDDGFEDDEDYYDDDERYDNGCENESVVGGAIVAGGLAAEGGRGRGRGRGRGQRGRGRGGGEARGRGAGSGSGGLGGPEGISAVAAGGAAGGAVAANRVVRGRPARGVGRRAFPRGFQIPAENVEAGGERGLDAENTPVVVGGAAAVAAAAAGGGAAAAGKLSEKPTDDELRKTIYEDDESDPDIDEPLGPHGLRPIRPSEMFLAQTKDGRIVNLSAPIQEEERPKRKKKKPLAKMLQPVERGDDFDNYRSAPDKPAPTPPAKAEYNIPTPVMRDDRAHIQSFLDRKGMQPRATMQSGMDF